MLIKEENMRRFVFAVVLVAMLALPVSGVFAAEPQVIEQIPDGWWLLGEIWWTPDWVGDPGSFGFLPWTPGERVDSFMTRPSTMLGWPLTQAPITGDWWWTGPASVQRRMSYEFSGDDYKFANEWGGYYAQWLLPRDEVWFPCDYPLQWRCNTELAPGVWEYHSPAWMAYECIIEGPYLICLDWPWVDIDPVTGMNMAAPYDTISPVVVDIFNPDSPFPYGYQFELEIAGYFWKFSDIP
jgi:hypothetical protein